MEANSLTHWGIKGMRWGVRRTPEQLGHKKSKKRENELSDDRKRINELMKKNVQSLSNQELNDILNRLGSEDRYKQLTNSKTQKKGESWTKKTMSKVGVLTSAAVSAYIFKVGKKAVSALMEPIIEGAIEGWTGNPIKHSEVNMDGYESDYLTHYGIKGMKWGVRKEYEPHPRKKNRYGKKLVKTIRKTKGGYSDKKRAIRPIVNKMITDDIANQIEKAHSDLMKNRPNVNFAEIDDEVFYLIERDYDRLEKIAKKKLKTENDDAIFQEILDIAENEVMSKYPGVKEQNDRWEKAVSNYMSEVTRITNEIVGEFSDIKINPNDQYSSTIGKYVEQTIFDYIEEKFNKGSLA